jgi:hypothetical protein
MSGSPSYNYRPDFVASNQDCIIQKSNETRARLWIGGTFFRSIEAGQAMNFIYVSITNNVDNIFVVTISKRSPTTGLVTDTETYTVEEIITAGSPTVPPDPNVPGDTGTSGVPDQSTAIPALRQLINANSKLVYMMDRAIDALGVPVNPPPDIYDTSGDASSISVCDDTPLANGTGAPTPPPPSLRTGPERSLFYIESSEYHAPLYPGDVSLSSTNGQLLAIYQTIEWDGDSETWLHYTPMI